MIFKTSAVGGVTFHTLLNDQIISKSLEYYGEWCFGEIQLLARLLSRDANVVELGSNIGSHTVFLAKFLCPQGTIYGFEPRRLYFQTLCANLISNGISNVHAFQLGVGEDARRFLEGAVPTQTGMNAGGFALGALAGSEETIEVIALDKWSTRFKPITLIKADIEGHELAALKGAAAILKKDRPLIYLEANKEPTTPDLLRHLTQLNYLLWWHTPPYFRRDNRGGAMTNIFGQLCAYNVLAYPAEKRDQLGEDVIKAADLKPIDNFDWHPSDHRP